MPPVRISPPSKLSVFADIQHPIKLLCPCKKTERKISLLRIHIIRENGGIIFVAFDR